LLGRKVHISFSISARGHFTAAAVGTCAASSGLMPCATPADRDFSKSVAKKSKKFSLFNNYMQVRKFVHRNH
jgi:hypothetical protein